MDVPLYFAVVTAASIVVYVLADGFDLGVGILFLTAPRETDRDSMILSVEPAWDGNETWLVLAGTLLFAAFPPAYYVLLPAFYLPIMLMLFALVFRGVAFAFRFRTVRHRRVWDVAFAVGSLVATFSQGLILGGLLAGVRMEHGVFSGGTLDCLTVLGVLCGLGLVGGYALLGAGWLIWKTNGPTQVYGREIGRAALILTATMMLLVSGWTILEWPEISTKWFSWPNIALLAPVPLITALAMCAIWRSLWGSREPAVFFLSLGLFLLGFIGLAVDLWPYVVPRQITISNGAADAQSLRFAGVGLAVVLPVVLAYQLYAYWVFRGKADANPISDVAVPASEG